MPNAYHDIAFTDAVREIQTGLGSRRAYAAAEDGPVTRDRLGADERALLAEADSFYMATVSETGWSYLQHRGGPKGFVQVLDDATLGFADFRGNRQYVSLGNLRGDDRAALFFMDYPRQARLKIFARAEVIGPDDARLQQLCRDGYRGRVERGILFHLSAFDWNCPQHITQRYTIADIEAATARMGARIAELEAELARLRTKT